MIPPTINTHTDCSKNHKSVFSAFSKQQQGALKVCCSALSVIEEIEAEDGNRIPNINFILDIGEGKVEELITYNQLLDPLEQAEDQDNSMDQELYKCDIFPEYKGAGSSVGQKIFSFEHFLGYSM